MKIYEIGTGYTPIPAQMGAATEIVVEELTRSFNKSGDDVEIIDIKARERAKTDLPISEVGVPSMFTKTDVSLGIMHKLKRVVYSLSLASYLKRILKKAAGETVLHFHNQYNLFFALKLIPKKLMKKATVAYTVHSYIWHGAWEDIAADIKKRYFQELYCLKRADLVFVLNENTKNNIISHSEAIPERVHMIDNGVNTNVYYPLPEKPHGKYGLEGKTVFVQVGSVCDRKNQLGAVELLLPLLKNDKDAVFCYAGGIISDEYQASITDFAAKNGISDQIVYLGEKRPGEQINEVYNLAKAMIFPSKAEGFSLVIIEAMSAGVPVLIPDSLKFELADRCIKYSSDSDFREKLTNEILDPEKQASHSKKARQTVEERYGWSKIASDYKTLFSEKN